MGADATLLLDKNALEQLLTPAEVTQAVREAFLLHGRREGRAQSRFSFPHANNSIVRRMPPAIRQHTLRTRTYD